MANKDTVVLSPRGVRDNDYYSAITSHIDSMCNMAIIYDSSFRHYLDGRPGDDVLSIRIPGVTVGGVYLNKDNIITHIEMLDKYISEGFYPKDVVLRLADYEGRKVEFMESKSELAEFQEMSDDLVNKYNVSEITARCYLCNFSDTCCHNCSDRMKCCLMYEKEKGDKHGK